MLYVRTLWIAAIGLSAVSLALAGDWPQWRGPDRNGVAASPALVTELPKEGPAKLWESEPIPGGDAGGWASVTVAAGKAYVYVNHNFPTKSRMFSQNAANAQGYAADMPAGLSKAVEDARVSDARKQIKDAKEAAAWADIWAKDNIKPDQAKWAPAALTRLKLGPAAVPLDVLAKLATVLGKKFNTQADAEAWLKDSGLPPDAQKQAIAIMQPAEAKDSEDFIYCLDAASGKTVWKTPLGTDWFWYPASSTPAIVDGKCYVWNSEGRIYCLDAAKGNVLWKSDSFGRAGFHHNRSSSVLVLDGTAFITSETCLAAVSIADGKTKWTDPKLTNQQCSIAPWSHAGKNWLLVNAGTLNCLAPSDGKAKWSVPAGGASTPVVAGEFAVVVVGDKEGVVAYKLSDDKAEVAWKVPFADTHSGAILTDKHVFVVGGAFSAAGKGHAMCISREDGKLAWDENLGQAQLSTPLLADRKVLAYNGGELVIFKADPAGFSLVGKANVGAEKWTSPSLADGKLFVRTAKNIVCYDLTKK